MAERRGTCKDRDLNFENFEVYQYNCPQVRIPWAMLTKFTGFMRTSRLILPNLVVLARQMKIKQLTSVEYFP